MSGDYAYVTDWVSGLTVVNISDSTKPKAVASRALTPGFAVSVYVSGDYAYLARQVNDGLVVIDISDPTNLTQVGIIAFPPTTNIQGQNVEVDDDGVIGYVAGFPNDTLYSFNVSTLSLEDPDGLALPGNPDRIARAGDRVAMVDTTNGRIMVADVTDPANMTLAGVIELPGANSFN